MSARTHHPSRTAPATPGALLLYCRPGFERECADEVASVAQGLGAPGVSRTEPDSGWVLFVPDSPEGADELALRLRWNRLTFARQLVFANAEPVQLPGADRVTPLVGAARALAPRFSALVVEAPDSTPGREVMGFCRRLTTRLEPALEAAGLLGGSPRSARLHIFFPRMDTAYLGISRADNASPWPQGIPRLRMAREAPSRSALKLAEALLTLLDEPERQRLLRAGTRAVDLGAAPGGWSWQLARHGIRVTAVDNGPMDRALLADGLVEHVRADGYNWRPRGKVDWMVCDMVDAPSRVAALVAGWVAEGRCRQSIFNLKLPMKKRAEELERCRGIISTRMKKAGLAWDLRIKHLYHDREEVTAFLTRRETDG
ncbi:MAG: 23S rRNA (cytidine(2498)-2'-O)-methyltransferase RlmM [Betaproteobacteria bacterium]|nr:23S rRNA (cytidine(2498)-2'-O)-methyltransferase RlmM [Betaproteobacteria bacterium]